MIGSFEEVILLGVVLGLIRKDRSEGFMTSDHISLGLPRIYQSFASRSLIGFDKLFCSVLSAKLFRL